jgi:hypothetical protein
MFSSRLTHFFRKNDFLTSLSFVQIYKTWINFFKNDKFLYQKFLFPLPSRAPSHRRRGSRLRKLGNRSLAYLAPFNTTYTALRLENSRRIRKAKALNMFNKSSVLRRGHLNHQHFGQYLPLFQLHYFKMFNPYIRVRSRIIGIDPQESRRTIVR